MSQIKYFFQFIFIFSLFIIFKLIGLKLASNFSSKIISLLGPLLDLRILLILINLRHSQI